MSRIEVSGTLAPAFETTDAVINLVKVRIVRSTEYIAFYIHHESRQY